MAPVKLWEKFKHLFGPRDLTKGPIAKGLLLFMIPTMLSLLFQQFYTMADAAIVGKTLTSEAFAGINNSSPLVFLILEFGVGCASGFAVVVGERFGAKDDEGARKSFFVQIILSLFVAAIMTGLGIALTPWVLSVLRITPSSSDPSKNAIYENARLYLTILFSGCIGTVFYNMLVAVLRAKGDSFFPFLILVCSTLLNIALDALFVIAFGWGVAGSAIATILSQVLAALVTLLYTYVRYPELRIHKEDTKSPMSFYWRHIKLGFPLGLQYSVLAIGMIVMQASIVAFDVDSGGAFIDSLPAELGYGAGCKIINLLFCPLNALGQGILTFVSQNHGAGDQKRIKQGIKAAIIIGMISWAICNLVGLLMTINGAYQYLFLSRDKVTQTSILYGNIYLYISVPGLYFILLLFVVRNTLQGYEKPLWPFVSGVAELLARVAVCLFVPYLFTGGQPINSGSSMWAYAAVASSDAVAWIISPLVSLPALIIVMKKKDKEGIFQKQIEEDTISNP